MAINHATDQAALLALFTSWRTGAITDSDAADQLATAIENIVLSATVTGTATGVTSGPSTAPVTGSLS